MNHNAWNSHEKRQSCSHCSYWKSVLSCLYICHLNCKLVFEFTRWIVTMFLMSHFFVYEFVREQKVFICLLVQGSPTCSNQLVSYSGPSETHASVAYEREKASILSQKEHLFIMPETAVRNAVKYYVQFCVNIRRCSHFFFSLLLLLCKSTMWRKGSCERRNCNDGNKVEWGRIKFNQERKGKRVKDFFFLKIWKLNK